MANMEAIKTLRNKTGAGFADCKKALEEAGEDIEGAIKILKEMGKAAAAKRADRATGEGSLFIAIKDNTATILELLCETDFVARNDEFQALGKQLANMVIEQNLREKNDEMQGMVSELVGKIKENMEINRIIVLNKKDDEIFSSYTHNVPARLASIVVLQSSAQNEQVEKFAFNCALHCVAKIPLFLDPESISEEYKNEQMQLIHKEVAELDKPEHIAQGIADGKWKKHTTEICLTLQSWAHDDKSTTEKEINALAKEIGGTVKITNFAVTVLGAE